MCFLFYCSLRVSLAMYFNGLQTVDIVSHFSITGLLSLLAIQLSYSSGSIASLIVDHYVEIREIIFQRKAFIQRDGFSFHVLVYKMLPLMMIRTESQFMNTEYRRLHFQQQIVWLLIFLFKRFLLGLAVKQNTWRALDKRLLTRKRYMLKWLNDFHYSFLSFFIENVSRTSNGMRLCFSISSDFQINILKFQNNFGVDFKSLWMCNRFLEGSRCL